jgi:probable HAF family extracellular repeat protein
MTTRKRKTSFGLLLGSTLTLTSAHAASPLPSAAACATPITAAGTYRELSVPGAKQTEARGVNNRGDIVGFYAEAQDQLHGFLYASGVLTTIDVPDADWTVATDINNSGTIVGYFADRGLGLAHGFVLRHGTFSTIDAPGAFVTEINAINSRGDIVGTALEPNGDTGTNVGFVRYRDSSFERIAIGMYSYVADINDRGDLLVNGNDLTGQFLRVHGEYHSIQACGAFAFRITNQLHLAGTTSGPSSGSVGFVLTPRSYLTYRYPGAAFTVLRDVNASGVVVGAADNVGFLFLPR